MNWNRIPTQVKFKGKWSHSNWVNKGHNSVLASNNVNPIEVQVADDHLSGKELFIRFTARAFRKLLSIYVFSYFPFGFEGKIWDLIVSVPDHCLSFYFANSKFQDSG